jgi:hypothetical protein
MSRERRSLGKAQCRCGQGEVEVVYSENDYPGMRNLDESEDDFLRCPECTKEYVLCREVDNAPPRADGRAVVYYVKKSEWERCEKLNFEAAVLSSSLRMMEEKVTQLLVNKLEALGKGPKATFPLASKLFGFASVEDMEDLLGRTWPRSWVPRYVDRASTPRLLRCLGKDAVAQGFEERVQLLSAAKARGKVLPTAFEPERPALELGR